MSTVKTHHYTVSGSGPFPFDMLRYDRAWPATERASHEIEAATRAPRGVRYSVGIEGLKPPTEARWKSFGWQVVV